ncbi:alpha-L-fucosidase [Caulobacter segnis]
MVHAQSRLSPALAEADPRSGRQLSARSSVFGRRTAVRRGGAQPGGALLQQQHRPLRPPGSRLQLQGRGHGRVLQGGHGPGRGARRAQGDQSLPWQTDTSNGDWFFNEHYKYKTSGEIIALLADIVSKNGNMLLNVVLRADGALPPESDTAADRPLGLDGRQRRGDPRHASMDPFRRRPNRDRRGHVQGKRRLHCARYPIHDQGKGALCDHARRALRRRRDRVPEEGRARGSGPRGRRRAAGPVPYGSGRTTRRLRSTSPASAHAPCQRVQDSPCLIPIDPTEKVRPCPVARRVSPPSPSRSPPSAVSSPTSSPHRPTRRARRNIPNGPARASSSSAPAISPSTAARSRSGRTSRS